MARRRRRRSVTNGRIVHAFLLSFAIPRVHASLSGGTTFRRSVMKVRTLLLLLPILAGAPVVFAQQPAAPAQPPGIGAFANIKSPVVAPGGKVTFRLMAPKSSSVSVICE